MASPTNPLPPNAVPLSSLGQRPDIQNNAPLFYMIPVLPNSPGSQVPHEIIIRNVRDHEESPLPLPERLLALHNRIDFFLKNSIRLVGIPMTYSGGALLLFGCLKNLSILARTRSPNLIREGDNLYYIWIGALFYGFGRKMMEGGNLTEPLTNLLWVVEPFLKWHSSR